MNGRSYIYKISVCIFIFSLCMQCGCAKRGNSDNDGQTQSEFIQLIAERPAPDLETLAERSSPTYTGEDTIEAFHDILKLRDIGNSKAAPVLEKILSDHVNSTRIHGYAAAQALFCIGTPEAHQVLSKYLLNEKYYAGLSINYIYHWEMDKSKRDSFIEQYHLRSISEDMAIKISTKTNKDENGQKLNFTITLTNISQEPYRIQDKHVFLGEMLFFQSETGQFGYGLQTADYKMPIPKWIDLQPGKTHEYDISMHVWPNTQKPTLLGKDENVSIMLQTIDVQYGLEKPGIFKVYAMYENQPLSKEYLEKLDFDNPWSGRVISKPVTVDIRID